MLYGWNHGKLLKEESISKSGAERGSRSLKWVGVAIFVLTVPGGLVLWLGQEVIKRGTFSPGSGWLWTSRSWINRKLTWTIPAIEKITP